MFPGIPGRAKFPGNPLRRISRGKGLADFIGRLDAGKGLLDKHNSFNYNKPNKDG